MCNAIQGNDLKSLHVYLICFYVISQTKILNGLYMQLSMPNYIKGSRLAFSLQKVGKRHEAL